MYMQNALLFPRQSIRALKNVRGPRFAQLVEHVSLLPECHEETLAFMLMMIQLNGCVSCATDSYRAMNGCSLCAYRVLKRFKGSDDDLFDRYHNALREIRAVLGPVESDLWEEADAAHESATAAALRAFATQSFAPVDAALARLGV